MGSLFHQIPVPVSVTVCGLFAALSRIVKVAERATLRFGVKVTLIVQLAPACRPAPPIGQVLDCPNRLGFAPPSVMLLMINGTVLVFCTVTVCGALVVLIGCVPNAIDAGVTLTVGRVVVPVSETDRETAGAATFTFKFAALVALLLGVNVTFTVQLPPAGRPGNPNGQLLVCPNRPGFAPPRVMLLILSGAVPVLETVTVCAALVTFSAEVNVSAVGETVRTGAAAPVTVSVPAT